MAYRLGEGVTGSVLTKSKVQAARRLFGKGTSLKAIARKMNVNERTLEHAIYGETWKHLPGAVKGGTRTGGIHSSAKLTASNVLEARQLYRDGHGTKAIAKLFGVRPNNVEKAIRGDTFKYLPDPVRRGDPRGQIHREYQRTISDEDVAAIKAYILAGESASRIAACLNIPAYTVGRIKRNEFRTGVLPAKGLSPLPRFPRRWATDSANAARIRLIDRRLRAKFREVFPGQKMPR